MTDLRRLAEAATPGPWHWEGDAPDGAPEHCPHGTEWTDHGPDLLPADSGPPDYKSVITSSGFDASSLHISDADAAYIAAANPQAVLALLDRVARLEVALRRCIDAAEVTAHLQENQRQAGNFDWFAALEPNRHALAAAREALAGEDVT